MEAIDDDRQLRAMVSLIEAQADQVSSLRHAVDRLEGLLAIRAELDTMVAHEVRTPLTVVHGVLATLQHLPGDHPDRDQLVAQALTHTGRLSDVVKHLLMPAGEVVPLVDRAGLECVAFDVVADRVLDEIGRRVPHASVVVDAEADLSVATSLPRIESLLVHLVEHACERADDGVVELRAARLGDCLRIEVADRGAPLDPEGDWFAPSTGTMPLYLARMLARSMGGDVILADRPGGGCLALVELPQRRVTDSPI
jgi:signal transduction histidine kinase